MTQLDYLPVELVLRITECLDVISLIRLSWISTKFYQSIGLSKSFWSAYCRHLLRDEDVPLPDNFGSLELSALSRLATRKERISRATHPNYWLPPPRGERTQFQLGHDPNLTLQPWAMRLTPGGRWVVAIARASQSGPAAHLLCWDTYGVETGDPVARLPVATFQLELPSGQHPHVYLQNPRYDPESQSIYCIVVIGELRDQIYSSKMITFQVEFSETVYPSFHQTGRMMTWTDDPGSSLSLSSRSAVICPEGEEVAILWDPRSGDTIKYAVERPTPTSFETVVVTFGGAVLRVRGEVIGNDLHLGLLADPASKPHPGGGGTFCVSGVRGDDYKSCGHINYDVSAPGILRVSEQEIFTVVRVQCTTPQYNFYAMVAVSDAGTRHDLPLSSEPWRWNEYSVPTWSHDPVLHFQLAKGPYHDRRFKVRSDDKELLLVAMPHGREHPSLYTQREVLSVPTQPSDIGARPSIWECEGVCPRSGSWLFITHTQDTAPQWIAMIIRYA
ncbi:hypothetical protein DL93DRAFT_2229863 [Clavulina sp. PMI_390]|nr:hypothetical protein DL93DRAFT_2229863 [Clavulina sp. PMI_390]